MTEPLLPANWATGNTFTAANENLVENSANWAQGGRVYLDSFAGANDDAKLTAALSYAAAQTHIPAVVLPARSMTFNTGGRTPFTGMRILGPPGCLGPKNLELGIKLANHVISLNVGVDASAWFNGASGTYYDIYMEGLAIQSGGTSQFWSQPGGTLYACQFDSMTFYGMAHIFGSATTKCLLTQVIFSGMWEILGGTGCQFYIGGSDCCFWMDGYCNFGTSQLASPADVYGLKFETLGKTSIGYLYLTNYPAWAGMLLSGAGTGVSFHGGTYEGAGAQFATKPAITITGGDWSFHGGAFNYVTTAQGIIVQSGGRVAMFGPASVPASSPSPFFYQTAGSAVIYAPANIGTVLARWSTGSTVTLAYNTINHNP